MVKMYSCVLHIKKAREWDVQMLFSKIKKNDTNKQHVYYKKSDIFKPFTPVHLDNYLQQMTTKISFLQKIGILCKTNNTFIKKYIHILIK